MLENSSQPYNLCGVAWRYALQKQCLDHFNKNGLLNIIELYGKIVCRVISMAG